LNVAAKNNDFDSLALMLDSYFLVEGNEGNAARIAESTLRNSFNQIRSE